MAALNSAFRAESSYENLHDHIELFNTRSLPRCLPSGAPPVNETYQEEAVYQNYEGNNRPVATNSAFRAEPDDEHLYDHIELSNRQPVPSGATAENQIYQEEVANQTYEGNNRPQEPMKNIAIRHRMSFAMIAVLVLCLVATVGASISLAIIMSSDGGQWITTDLREDIMATKNQTKEMQRMNADLKKDIMATNVNQTDGMKEMIKDLKKDIMATNVNQTDGMKQMIEDLKKDILMATRNRAREMQTITPHLKEDRMATKNQTERMTTKRFQN